MSETNIRPDMFIPEVIEKYPSTRAVFDSYGLKGCGGPKGPRESIDWFARLHGVPIDQLMIELNEAAAGTRAEVPASLPSLADSIYRPFFLTGILTVLSLGCVWGAINLYTIGAKRDFGGVNYSWILAHGHAMVFGFVGLFIMGFAYQAIPRFKHTTLWGAKLAYSTLPLMAGGIIVQTVAHLMAPDPLSLPLGILSGILQLIAVGIFALTIAKTIEQSKRHEPYDDFIYCALLWFGVAAVANPIIFRLFEAAGDAREFLFNIMTYNIPYRDVQIMGIAVVMILGISLRFLPHAYGLREPSALWRTFLLLGVNGAVAIGVAAFLMRKMTGDPRMMLVSEAAALILLVAAIGTPWQFRLFGPVAESERDRGLKFIRAAYIWFIAAMAMYVFVPVYNIYIYQPITGAPYPFSHAFFGAYRHAITVGFIMMMIVGVSSKVVPLLSGVDVKERTSLMPTFLLLNIGNMIRISTEIATDFIPGAYSLMGFSGFIEVVGLVLWGFEIFSNIRSGARLQREQSIGAAGRNEQLIITPQTKVGDVLDSYPQSLDIFLKFGFTPLSNPVLRKTMTRVVTLERACRLEDVDLDSLLAELNSHKKAQKV
jgi:hypothetical protein